MFGDKHWKDWLEARWVACGCLGLVTFGLLSVAGERIYRRNTLPERIASGRVLFEHVWQPADPLANGGDGLGPVFNEQSCVACHFQGGVGGSGTTSKNVAAFEVLPTDPRRQILRGVVHASATRPDLRESFQLVSVRFPVIPGGLTVVDGCTTKQRDFNPVVQANVNTPALFGAGLIDGLSTWSIYGDGLRRNAQVMAKELSADFSGTPIGEVRKLPGGRVGKFGWKGQFATLGEFVAAACAVELGLTNPEKSQILPREFCEDSGAALDINRKQLDALVSYVAALPRPVEILPDDPTLRRQAIRGKLVFGQVGCADCHTPDLGDVQGIYSDFRLYEIEPKRSAGYSTVNSPAVLPADQPKADEWKTPPLWGVADSAPYFHDGASPTLSDAILRHDGSANKSRHQFKRLPASDREALLTFLGTLKAPR
ncbi:MAG: c-type cytochrome [Planctomycetia bacterium]|nr:c-type cytochrome [Planctomycetia bacterium]